MPESKWENSETALIEEADGLNSEVLDLKSKLSLAELLFHLVILLLLI